MRGRLAVALFLVLAVFAAAQETAQVRVSSSVDRSSVTVGDVVRYTLAVEWAKGVTVTPPSLGVNLGQFEIRDYKAGEPKGIESGRTRLETTYEIAAYDVGTLTIPGVPIRYKDASGAEKTIDSEPISILVAGSNPDLKGTIRDLRGPVGIPVDWTPYLLIGGGALLAALLGIGGYLYYRAWRARRAKLAEARVPADQWALARLEELRAAGHVEAGRLKEYFSGLSEILRGYVERRYRVPALERTTDELAVVVAALPIAKDLGAELLDRLATCDLVKFAKHVPDADVPVRMLEEARAFIHATKEALAPAPMPMPTPTSPATRPATGEGAG
jgi:hypothetical protein